MTKLWNNLIVSTQFMAPPDFKDQLKIELKPKKIKHYSKGSKIGNTLSTRIRLERSNLNLHKVTTGISETPECLCHAIKELSFHYLLECLLYSGVPRLWVWVYI